MKTLVLFFLIVLYSVLIAQKTDAQEENYTLPADPGTGEVILTGELKKWHKITLSFNGPFCNETDNTPNPFLDYRLIVSFSNGTNTYLVPGYFAADGDAAETSASSGNVWRVHFAPDAEGTWNWKAFFRIGENVAVSLNESEGEAVRPIDGKTGSFDVVPTDKSGKDLRGKGRLEYVGMHHLRFAETGEYFLKGGPDSPENMLAYEDFDGNFKTDGHADNRVKSWSPHAGDWNSGDPSWQGGKGTEIIGAVNYLASKGLNAFSFLTMNINGDDKNVFPYVSYSNYQHMDCSKLDQWGMLFDHATTKGMYLHFKTQETENETLLDGGKVETNRKLYYRELVARFGHHLALNWNLGEENNDQTHQQRKDMAQYFYDIDPYHHNIVLHTYPGGQNNIYTPLLGSASKLTGVSIQTGWNNVHNTTGEWVKKSAAANKKWVVANDEQGNAKIGVPHDTYTGSPGIDDIRKQTLWGNLMAGGAGVEYYFGYDLPNDDLDCEDYSSRDKSWDYVRFALEFFKNNNIPFWQMFQKDELVSNGWCLADEEQVYVIYLANGGTTNLTLNSTDTFDVRWYDPRNGGDLQEGSVSSLSGTGAKSLGAAPSNASKDWVVLVTNANGINLSPTAEVAADVTSGSLPLTVNFDASDSYDSDGTISSYAWDFADGSSGTGTMVRHVFYEPGTYEIKLTVTDNNGAISSAISRIKVTDGINSCGYFTQMMSKDFPLNGFYLDNYTGQDLLGIQPKNTPVTAATEMAFAGESCMYDIIFHGVGESDGQSSFKIFVNDIEIGSYTLPLSAQGYELGSEYNLEIQNVSINNGDIIKIEGTTATDGTEWSRARWLKLEFTPAGSICGEAEFVERYGIVVVEVESVPAGTGWSEESSVSGFTGTSYYRWNGGNRFNNPGNGMTEYKIKINNPGTYHFRWHSKIMHGTDATESNDSWLRIPDADDFFAKKGSSVKYPVGGMFVQSNVKTNGSSANGWMKVYSSGTTNWTWSCRTSDNDAHEIYATFNEPGVYTVQISGRSNNHAIDRFVLFNNEMYSVSEATVKSLDETTCTGGGGGPKYYNLRVVYGTGAGSYLEGQTINISADTIQGKEFTEWIGAVANVSDIYAPSTTYTMGAADAFISANYKDSVYLYSLIVNNGKGDGEYESLKYINVEANDPPEGQVFDQWTGNVERLLDKTSATTRCFMPDYDMTITATYKDDQVSSASWMKQLNIELYPNPADQSLHISNLKGRGTIQFVSLTGKKLEYINYTEDKITLDVSEYHPGIYLVIISSLENPATIKKLVVR